MPSFNGNVISQSSVRERRHDPDATLTPGSEVLTGS
jgi:hypothetical protein